MILILIFGIILRLILSASSFHADIRAFDLGGLIIANGNFFNFYDYLSNLPQDHILVKTYTPLLFIYPPAIYFLHGLFNFIFGSFVDKSVVTNFLTNYESLLGNFQLSIHLLLLKIPYLPFDLAAAYFLSKLFDRKKDQLIAFTIWIFNPINLYTTYLMGQFDIIPTFFVIFSLYLVSKTTLSSKHINLAALALGIGAAFKIYPLFLLLPLSFLGHGWQSKFKIMILGILPYLVTILPFLPSQGFRTSALVAGQTLKSFYAQLPISGGEGIIYFLGFLIFFYLVFLYRNNRVSFIWQRFFLVLLLFFIFTHYHPQWFLWLTPFLIIDLIKSNYKHTLLILLSLFSFTSLLFFFDSGLNISLFAPAFPNLVKSPSIWEILNIKVDYNFARSIFQTIFVSTALYFIYCYFPKQNRS